MFTQQRLLELRQYVGEWASGNFNKFAPEIGILEEVGEIAHCVLKRLQGIRGFDDPAHFTLKLKDAIGDAAIYAFHLAYLNEVDIDFTVEPDITPHREPINNAKNCLSDLANSCCFLLDPDLTEKDAEFYLRELFTFLDQLARIYDLEFEECVEDTWSGVKKRNWRVNPVDADQKA